MLAYTRASKTHPTLTYNAYLLLCFYYTELYTVVDDPPAQTTKAAQPRRPHIPLYTAEASPYTLVHMPILATCTGTQNDVTRKEAGQYTGTRESRRFVFRHSPRTGQLPRNTKRRDSLGVEPMLRNTKRRDSPSRLLVSRCTGPSPSESRRFVFRHSSRTGQMHRNTK